jgi:RNA polymerase sigma-70 factor (ECF subfamily)
MGTRLEVSASDKISRKTFMDSLIASGRIGVVRYQTTHTTLLRRVSDGEDEAWEEFCGRYGRLIRNVARRRGLQTTDCDDVLQNVLLALAKSMPSFRYDPTKGKFRSYLKTVVERAIRRKFCQDPAHLPLEPDDAPADQGAFECTWDDEWRQYHVRCALKVIEAEFNEADRRAFQLFAVEGRNAKTTAEGLDMSVDQVYQAKSRIARRLKQIVEEQVREEG